MNTIDNNFGMNAKPRKRGRPVTTAGLTREILAKHGQLPNDGTNSKFDCYEGAWEIANSFSPPSCMTRVYRRLCL